MAPRKKKIKVDSSEYIKVSYPVFYFALQTMIKERGVSIIDLNNGKVIEGLVNVDTIGMVLNLSLPKGHQIKGNSAHYLLPPKNSPKNFDVEATLNIYEPQDPLQPIIVTIQVVNQNQIQDWEKIFLEIIKDLINSSESQNKEPFVLFYLIPLSLPDPNNPTSATDTILGNIQNYRAEDEQKSLNLSIIQPYYSPPKDLEDNEGI